MDTPESEFESLLSACQEIARSFPEGVVFIGGIAVYLHAINNELTQDLAEFTHDGDMYISLADMADLRDMEALTPNRRQYKHQMIKKGFEFDIYTERYSSLRVPYDALITTAAVYDGIKVASLEYLLVLKLEAYRDRHASSKGQKDAKDIIRLAMMAHQAQPRFSIESIAPYLDDKLIALCRRVERGSEITGLAKGNAQVAKRIRQSVSWLVDSLDAAISGPTP